MSFMDSTIDEYVSVNLMKRREPRCLNDFTINSCHMVKHSVNEKPKISVYLIKLHMNGFLSWWCWCNVSLPVGSNEPTHANVIHCCPWRKWETAKSETLIIIRFLLFYSEVRWNSGVAVPSQLSGRRWTSDRSRGCLRWLFPVSAVPLSIRRINNSLQPLV